MMSTRSCRFSSLLGTLLFSTRRVPPGHTGMSPKPSPPSAGKPSKRRASDASGLQQSDLRDAFGASPKHARRGSLASEDPLEVHVTPRQYDAFTVKFLETEGTARGFSAADREEDSRRSGEARDRRSRSDERPSRAPALGRRDGRAFFKSRVSSPKKDLVSSRQPTSRATRLTSSTPPLSRPPRKKQKNRDGVRRRVRRAAA